MGGFGNGVEFGSEGVLVPGVGVLSLLVHVPVVQVVLTGRGPSLLLRGGESLSKATR